MNSVQCGVRMFTHMFTEHASWPVCLWVQNAELLHALKIQVLKIAVLGIPVEQISQTCTFWNQHMLLIGPIGGSAHWSGFVWKDVGIAHVVSSAFVPHWTRLMFQELKIFGGGASVQYGCPQSTHTWGKTPRQSGTVFLCPNLCIRTINTVLNSVCSRAHIHVNIDWLTENRAQTRFSKFLNCGWFSRKILANL